ncbi:MAG: hypothetical protein GY849_02185 [Deltaproteobacteria bacterium]|nr:hypothetical protein [Deltaproteobacteria bacterium]
MEDEKGIKTNFGDKRNTNGFDKNPSNINKTGENGKSISSILKKMGEEKIISYKLTLTDSDGNTKTKQGSLESKEDLNTVLASILFQKAITGDLKAIREILDRTEGKPKQEIESKQEIKMNAPKIIVQDKECENELKKFFDGSN